MTCRRMKVGGQCGSTSSASNCRPGAQACQSGVEPLADNLFQRLLFRPSRHNTPLPCNDKPRCNAVIDYRCTKRNQIEPRSLAPSSVIVTVRQREQQRESFKSKVMEAKHGFPLRLLCRSISLMRLAAPRQHRTSVWVVGSLRDSGRSFDGNGVF